MKVFLSHSTKDKGFVEKLAAAMNASGFTPWLCEVDIEKGANRGETNFSLSSRARTLVRVEGSAVRRRNVI